MSYPPPADPKPPNRSRTQLVLLMLLPLLLLSIVLLVLFLLERDSEEVVVEVAPTQTASITATPSASVTASATASNTPTATASSTPTASVTPSITPSPTDTSTVTPSPTNTPTDTPTVTPSPTATATNTPTSTFTPTPTPTFTLTPTNTPTPTPTPIPPQAIISAIDREAWLETERVLLNIDARAENDWPGILPGQRSLRYNAFVTVTGGVNLDLLTVDDIQVQGQTIIITLPQPQLRDCILDRTASEYYDRNCTAIGVIDAGCGGLEEDLVDIVLFEAANFNHDELLENAFFGASEVIQDLLSGLPVEQVIVQRSTAPLPQVAERGTCQVEE